MVVEEAAVAAALGLLDSLVLLFAHREMMGPSED